MKKNKAVRVTGPALAISIFFVLSNCSQNSGPSERAPKKSDNAKGTGSSPAPGAAPSPSPDTSGVTGGAATNCDAQWTQHVAYFKTGKQISYRTSIQALGQQLPATHTEQVLSSSDAQVTRKVTFTSTNSLATNLLNQVKIPDPFIVKKADFIALCNGASGTAQPAVVFGGGTAKVEESKAEPVTIGVGKFDAQYSRITAQITLNSQSVDVKGKIWSSIKSPGLILKQVIDLSNLPIAGNATITEELSSPE